MIVAIADTDCTACAESSYSSRLVDERIVHRALDILSRERLSEVTHTEETILVCVPTQICVFQPVFRSEINIKLHIHLRSDFAYDADACGREFRARTAVCVIVDIMSTVDSDATADTE